MYKNESLDVNLVNVFLIFIDSKNHPMLKKILDSVLKFKILVLLCKYVYGVRCLLEITSAVLLNNYYIILLFSIIN